MLGSKHFFQFLFILVCTVFGGGILFYFYPDKGYFFPALGGAAGLFLGLLVVFIEKKIKDLPFLQLLGSSIGLLVGLGVARLISSVFNQVLGNTVWEIFLYIMSMLGLGYLGLVLGGKKFQELKVSDMIEKTLDKLLAKALTPISTVSKKLSKKDAFKDFSKENLKVLDTSAIIDGRIVDIAKVGWIEGTVVIPKFILEEIQFLADSTEPIKRERGQRALDLLNELKKLSKVDLKIVETNYPKGPTDEKLIKFCKETGAKLITTDYNLNKVCQLEKVEVLNINDLFLALKLPVHPGEILKVQVVKEGKEKGQGVGYLEDGSMVVIENGRPFIGKEVEVVVTHLLHSSSGRIIFAQIKRYA
ncbi:TRAM domain-containing protein [Thermodesulfobacterium sp. TA1]|uniref:PIN/TRAM domain-containing protein n=1 Tax=Thermodesulfobacterium sp. TA1 TaxID=2234087 RepID=UPI001231C9AA|nr:PIN domain-containing protein [Thermodesulfobacterium sp. TA1]QER41505.1 TRAM domain-containing protein [Thermodesulfobacterium sp. TA1]